jgi:DNA polymerase III sliding clamp (beta) subunit (PCNA family)
MLHRVPGLFVFHERNPMNVIELPAGELKTALAGFNKIVSSRTTLPVLGCVRIEPHPEGINLQVTDLDSFATYQIRTEVPPDFPPCLVSLAPLAKVARTTKGTIALIRADKERFQLRHSIGSTPVEQPIESLPIEDWPAVPQIKAKPFLAELGFKEAFRNALECASAESTRLILNGVCLDLNQPDCHCVVATDGRHLFSANTFRLPLAESVVIPDRKFLNWSGFADDGDWLLAVEPPVTKKGETPGLPSMQIQSQHWTFLTRGIDGQYPDWRQIVPRPDRTFTTIKLSEEAVGLVLDALPRMPGTDDASQPVTLRIQAPQLILRSRPAQSNQWVEVPVSGVSIIGADQQVCLDRTFITKALRFGFTEFAVQDSLNPVLFTAPGRKFVAAVMRLDDAPVAPQADTQPTPTSPQEAVQAEAVEPAIPSAAQPVNSTETTNAMPTNNITTLPAPERSGLKPTNGNNGETGTAMKAVVEAVERIKTNLRDVVSDLNDMLDLLKAAEKEKKATLKEVESVRATLRSLQKVEL